MNNNTVIDIAKNMVIASIRILQKELFLMKRNYLQIKLYSQKKFQKQILGISAEIQGSEDIFGIFTDADNPTVNNIIAIEVINMTNHTSELLDLELINLYDL